MAALVIAAGTLRIRRCPDTSLLSPLPLWTAYGLADGFGLGAHAKPLPRKGIPVRLLAAADSTAIHVAAQPGEELPQNHD